jgi:CheY-like chemotaxis protein
VYLDQDYAAGQSEVVPGQYVMLAVTDSGTGMTPEVQAKAFDPFFTTKEVGQGTGLGLSQVYGFVKQSRGHVKIYSEPGEGTTIKLYLPRLHADGCTDADSMPKPRAPAGNGETILIVEDDPDVRASSVDMIKELGYSVLEAASGPSALQLLEMHPEIKLLFTDVGLPGGMNGRQLADRARARRRELKVLFTSGYARNAIVHDGRLDPGVELLSKPFTQDLLAARLRDILDASAASGRVLVVEDEVMIQLLAVQYLEELGLKADIAGSGTEALNKLRLIPGGVDAMVIDLGLPDRGGDVLLREVRALFPGLPVVLATGAGHDTARAVARTYQAITFLAKPYTRQGLATALRELGIRC